MSMKGWLIFYLTKTKTLPTFSNYYQEFVISFIGLLTMSPFWLKLNYFVSIMKNLTE